MKRAIFLLFGACAPGVPDSPSYQQHVAPILEANCVRCHGIPVLGGAPPGFRLDAYNDYTAGALTISGAKTYSSIVAMRVADGDRPMPPRFGLDDYQIETLEKWDAAGAPRGEPEPGNRPPTATVTNILKAVDEDGVEVRVKYIIDIDVRDPDPDVVGGALFANLGTNSVPIGLLRSGPNRIVWDTTNQPRAMHALEAKLDDGGEEISAALGGIDVEGP